MFLKLISISKIAPVLAMLLTLTLLDSVRVYAKDESTKNPSHSSPSPQMKKDMADMYQKMADCLKTEKSMHDCHKEVMKDCPVAKATGSCPLMDGMKGMMHDGKMKDMKMDHSKKK